MTEQTVDFISLVILERLSELPLVESALSKSAETYSKLKNLNQLIFWTLTTAEHSLSTATKQVMPIAVPIARRFETPINFIDNTLCRGLDKIEEKVPLVKQNAQEIIWNAYTQVTDTLAPTISRISYASDAIVEQATVMRDVNWKRTNEILNTRYGSMIITGVDNTSTLIDKLIEKYFPPMEEEKEEETKDITTAEEDKLLYIIQTIGCLSVKAAKRIYKQVIYYLHILKEKYIVPYIKLLASFLHITRCISEADKNKKQIPEDNEKKIKDDKEDNKGNDEKSNKGNNKDNEVENEQSMENKKNN